MKVTVTPTPAPRPPVNVRIDLNREEAENLLSYLISARSWDTVSRREDRLASDLHRLIAEQLSSYR